MVFDSFVNLVETTLGAPRALGADTFTVAAGAGERFGTFESLLFAATPKGNVAATGRIIDRTLVSYYRATGRSGDDLTGCALDEGTDRDYAVGDLLGVYILAQHITQLQQALTTKAEDAAVLHAAGAEDVAGPKTFLDRAALVEGRPLQFLTASGDMFAIYGSTSQFNGVDDPGMAWGLNIGPGADPAKFVMYEAFEGRYYLPGTPPVDQAEFNLNMSFPSGQTYRGFVYSISLIDDPAGGNPRTSDWNWAADRYAWRNITQDTEFLRCDRDVLITTSQTTRLAGVDTYNLTRALPTAVGGTVDLGTFLATNGGTTIELAVVVSSAGFVVSKRYSLTIRYDQTLGAWQAAPAAADSGPYAGDGPQDFAVDIKVAAQYVSLRLRRAAGTTAGVAHVLLSTLIAEGSTWSPSEATGTDAAPTAILGSTPYVVEAAAAHITSALRVDGSLTLPQWVRLGVTRTLGANAGDTVEIGSYQVSPSGGGLLRVAVAVNSSGFALGASWDVPFAYNLTGGAWQEVRPRATTGAYSGLQVRLDASVGGTILALRLRRAGASGTGGTAYVQVEYEGSLGQWYPTTGTATGVAAPTDDYRASAMPISLSGAAPAGDPGFPCLLYSPADGKLYVHSGGGTWRSVALA